MLAHRLYSAPWWHSAPRKLMPPHIYEGLSPRGQELCVRPGGGWISSAVGDLRPGFGVVVDHAMTDESVHWARSHLGPTGRPAIAKAVTTAAIVLYTFIVIIILFEPSL